MRDHLQSKPNEISQRYVFYKRDRKVDESIKDYVAKFRKLSEHCNFNQNLEDSLRDKLVCSLNDQKIQQKLLATRNLTLESAIDTAVAMEAAIRSVRDLHVSGRVMVCWVVCIGWIKAVAPVLGIVWIDVNVTGVVAVNT